jgi:hypothetical protein
MLIWFKLLNKPTGPDIEYKEFIPDWFWYWIFLKSFHTKPGITTGTRLV